MPLCSLLGCFDYSVHWFPSFDSIKQTEELSIVILVLMRCSGPSLTQLIWLLCIDCRSANVITLDEDMFGFCSIKRWLCRANLLVMIQQAHSIVLLYSFLCLLVGAVAVWFAIGPTFIQRQYFTCQNFGESVIGDDDDGRACL